MLVNLVGINNFKDPTDGPNVSLYNNSLKSRI